MPASIPTTPAIMSANTLKSHHAQWRDEYDRLRSLSLSLDMTRGKPSVQQLDLSNRILNLPGDELCDYHDDDGSDTRNYGGIDGLAAVKRLFGDILGVAAQNVIVGGNSSLTMMYDTLVRACQFGVVGGDCPWNAQAKRKFICPVPGYDRHFLITEHLGFELISVDMHPHGPDMAQVESLVAKDADIKGIWCVPKYSNPNGACYDFATVQRLASMTTAAADFRIMWDNAYAEHHLGDAHPPLENIAEHCEAAGNPQRIIQFASTSKMTHPGSGVAAMACSEANSTDAKMHIAVQSIGPDKVNQLRMLKLFGNLAGLRTHMKKHAALIKPKFDLVLEILEQQLSALGIATWSKPQGGYFISLDIADGTARRVVQLAGEAGVKLTSAGAPFPYGKDPRDRNVRIAPTYPPLQDIRQATEVLTACIKLATAERNNASAASN